MTGMIVLSIYMFMAGSLFTQAMTEKSEWGAFTKVVFVVLWPVLPVIMLSGYLWDRLRK